MTNPIQQQSGSIESGGRTAEPVTIVNVEQTLLDPGPLKDETVRLARRVTSRLPSFTRRAQLDMGSKGTLDVYNADTDTPSVTGMYRPAPGEVWQFQSGSLYPNGEGLVVVSKVSRNISPNTSTPLGGSEQAVTAIDEALDDLLDVKPDTLLPEGERHQDLPTGEPLAPRAGSDGLPSATWDDIARANEQQAARDAARGRLRIEAIDGQLQATSLPSRSSEPSGHIDPAHPPADMDDLPS